MSAAVEAVDGQPEVSERERDVSAARRRRHRSARSASIRSGQSVNVEGGREMEGGDEDESSSVYSSSTASTSARYRRSLKRIREKRQEKGIPQEPVGDEGRGDGVKTLPPRRQEEEEEEEEEGEPVVAADGGDSGLDDTTARITSLLQRIEGDTLQETQADDCRGVSPSPSPPPPPPPQPTLALTVHKTDRLRPDLGVTHPLVRVCLVTCETGELVKKPYPDRRVTSYYEEGVDYILPVQTQPWRKQGQSFQPEWEETLLFNEDLSLFTSHQNLLLFELLDFPSPASQTQQSFWSNRRSQVGGESWHQIAWAFLRAGGSRPRHQGGESGERGGGGGGGESGEMRERGRNVGKVCRLQLYCYPKRRHSRTLATISEIWELWHSYKRKPYPSTLYVTLNETTPTTTQTTPTTRSMDPSQPELGVESVEQMMDRLHRHTQRILEPPKKLGGVPARLPGHTCHLPTSLHSHLPPPRHVAGCSVLSFSPDGHYLGVGYTSTAHEDRYTVAVYEVSTMSVVLYSDAHRGFIYSLSWSHDNHMINTASADGLVKVWSVGSSDEVASLPHPCYMYTVCFIPPPPLTPHHPHSSPTPSPPPSHLLSLFTGGYDRVIRVWTLTPSRVQLAQELKGHRGHVNSICVASSSEVMYSGDSVGEVMVWRREGPDQQVWRFQRTISTQKSPAPVLSLCLHPGGRRLLVHTTTGRLAIVDLRV